MDIGIKALAMIKDKVSVEFHIYGDGKDRDSLKELIKELRLENRVYLMGSLPIYEIANRMANADLGIEPKRNDSFAKDAMSTKILEFMATGVPVIVSGTEVHRYYFNNSVVKFFKAGDENDLANCMLSLIQDQGDRQRLIENAFNFYKDFAWEKRKHLYLDLVNRLTAPNNSG